MFTRMEAHPGFGTSVRPLGVQRLSGGRLFVPAEEKKPMKPRNRQMRLQLWQVELVRRVPVNEPSNTRMPLGLSLA